MVLSLGRPWANPAQDPIVVAQLGDQARDAAQIGAYIYPSLEHPTGATAYSSVLALEAIEGELATTAEKLAMSLRQEFADDLVDMGDTYWQTAGGRGFASDFYAGALLFDPMRTDLRERTAITVGELAELRRRATAGDFSKAELQGGAVLSALAEPDPTKRRARLDAATRRATGLPTAVRIDMEQLAAAQALPAAAPQPRSPSSPVAEAVLTKPAPVPTQPTAVGSPPEDVDEKPSRDRATARAALAEAKASLRAGGFIAARTAFFRSLAADPQNHEALAGLSDVYFNLAEYQKALGFARRAVKLAPQQARYRLQLGDAYAKVLRYDDARREYEVAASLGHPGAAMALSRLRGRLGDD